MPRRLALKCRVRPDFALRLGEPHYLLAIPVACGDDEVRVILSRPVTLVVGHREAESLVLEITDDVIGSVKKVGEALLKIGVAGHLVRVTALAVSNDPTPLKTAQVSRIEPLGRP